MALLASLPKAAAPAVASARGVASVVSVSHLPLPQHSPARPSAVPARAPALLAGSGSPGDGEIPTPAAWQRSVVPVRHPIAEPSGLRAPGVSGLFWARVQKRCRLTPGDF